MESLATTNEGCVPGTKYQYEHVYLLRSDEATKDAGKITDSTVHVTKGNISLLSSKQSH